MKSLVLLCVVAMLALQASASHLFGGMGRYRGGYGMGFGYGGGFGGFGGMGGYGGFPYYGGGYGFPYGGGYGFPYGGFGGFPFFGGDDDGWGFDD